MASNKYDTPFKKVLVKEYTLTYKGLYDEEIKVIGTPKQIINAVLNNSYE